jgi:microcystin degradation protein MlrC/3-mercaptopyruvate sulfurtransferase SseA
MRIFSGSLATETNTFAPMPTGLSSFKDRGYYKAGQHPDHLSFFAAPLWAARLRAKQQPEKNWVLIEGMVAGAQPSGITTRYAYETLRDELLADLKAALPVDIVLLGLHGAMVADGYDDCEGDLLARVRALVGPTVVVGAELDLHNHLSADMIKHTDILVSFKEYPHTDVLERGFELVDLCVATWEGKIKPVPAVVDCHMICTIHTSREPARSFVDRLQALEGRDGVLSLSITHGFAWGDVPDMGTKVLAYADGMALEHAASKASELARKLADELIAMRESLAPSHPDVDQALDEALAFQGGPVVISDGADNPGGGAAGDSTFFLRRMIERQISNAALGPLWDPGAVRIAFDAGVGASLMMRLGGKISPLSGDPIDLQCKVKALHADMIMTGLSGAPVAMGDSALIETQGIEIVLITLRNQAMGSDMFTQLGCDLASKKIIVVKSSQHFYASFMKIGKHVIYAAAPGAVTIELNTLEYKNITRPKWPLMTPNTPSSRRDQMLVSTQWLEDHLDDPTLRIIDCSAQLVIKSVGPSSVESGLSAFSQAHIPGARYLNMADDLSDPDGAYSFAMATDAQIAAKFSALGVGNQHHIVLYGHGYLGSITRVWYVLQVAGHQNVSILDGGFELWKQEGRVVTDQATVISPENFKVQRQTRLISDADAVLAATKEAKACVINALSREQFLGTGGTHYGRPGHITGSVSTPARGMLDTSTNRFLPDEVLRAQLVEAGVTPGKHVISYCGGGIAASITAFVLQMLGHEQWSLYDHSLNEWARRSELPMQLG